MNIELKNYFQNTCGNLGLILGLCIVPLIGAVGVAVDVGRLIDNRTLMQGAADAAAIAAGSSGQLSNSALTTQIANDYLAANNATGKLQSVVASSSAVNPLTGNFTVLLSGTMNTSFLSVVGITEFPVSVSSEVNLGIQGLELALVLDNTGSMSGTKIASLKTSAKNLVSILKTAKASYADLKFGLVPFAQYVNVGAGNATQSWVNMNGIAAASWQGCVGSRNAPMDMQVGVSGGTIPAVNGVNCPAAAIQPLTSDPVTINTQIDAMVANGNTYIAGGLLWGWNVLDGAAPFTEGRTKAQLAAINGRKVVVLMTDGANTASPVYPLHSGSNVALADGNLSSACSAVKIDGIEIYTVLFEETDPNITARLTACATAPDHFFYASSNQALIDAFNAIGKQLADVRLVQ
jgi:Flp pilus assembly protein TadG